MMKTEVRIPGAFLEDVRKIILKIFQIILLKKIQVEKKRLFFYFLGFWSDPGLSWLKKNRGEEFFQILDLSEIAGSR